MTRTEADFTLDEQLCFALYTASRAMTGAYRDGLSELGLTYTQYAVLLVLWEQEQMPMGELGHRLQLDSATLSPVLKRMAEQGLLSRDRTAEDERRVRVAITAAGRQLREQAQRVQSEVELGTGLSEGELARLRTDLHQLAARLRQRSRPVGAASRR